jgi:ABC-type uncharacterized transport system involved in gliding motility auxiliary subunit
MMDNFRVAVVFPQSRSVTPVATAPEGKTVQKLIETSPAAWAETGLQDLKPGMQPQLDTDKGDKAGPVSLGVTVTTASAEPAPDAAASADQKDAAASADAKAPPKPPQTRLLVLGDSEFASNQYAGNVGNADFFMNAVNWLSAQENLIAIRPREPGDSRLTITPGQVNLVWWTAVLIIPAAVLGTGVFTWARRRNT